jgi:hypothetical protein
MMISNTSTIISYTWNYFFACLCILIIQLLIWLIYSQCYSIMLRDKYSNSFSRQSRQYFVRRTIYEHKNVDLLVRLRQQSTRLLPYAHIIVSTMSNGKQHPDGNKHNNRCTSSRVIDRHDENIY